MASGDPDWDVATVTRDMLRDPAGTGSSDFGDLTGINAVPDDRIVLSNTEAGKGISYTEEYVLVSETGERGRTYRYQGLTGYDASAVAFVEFATPTSRARREELWEEILAIVDDHRKRSASPGTPGAWDNLEVDGAPVEDEAFNWWAMEVSFMFDAVARSVT